MDAYARVSAGGSTVIAYSLLTAEQVAGLTGGGEDWRLFVEANAIPDINPTTQYVTFTENIAAATVTRTWASATVASGAYSFALEDRNKRENPINNCNFDVWVRTPTGAATVSADPGKIITDRWRGNVDIGWSGPAVVFTKYDVRHERDWRVRNALRIQATIPPGEHVSLIQKIPGGYLFNEDYVTLSLMNKKLSGDVIPVYGKIVQNFGSGVASLPVLTNLNTTPQYITLAPNSRPTRIAMSNKLPTVNGKTFSGNNDDMLWVELFFGGGGATLTADFLLSGISLHPGQTDLEDWYLQDPEDQKLKCKRFYARYDSLSLFWRGNTTSGQGYATQISLPAPMYKTPTVTATNISNSNFNPVVGTLQYDKQLIRETRTATGTGTGYFSSTYAADAEIS